MSSNALTKPTQAFIEISFNIFATLPREVAEDDLTPEFRMCVLQSSQMFRNALRTLNDEISSIAESGMVDESTASQFDAEFDMIYTIEQVWHICEIVLLNPANQVYSDTAKWLKAASRPIPVESAKNFLKLQEQPELLKLDPHDPQSFDYWDLIFKLLMQGNIDDATEILVLHSEISAAFLLDSDEISSSSAGGSYGFRSPLDRSHCHALFDLIMSHPYARMLNDSKTNANGVSLQDWQSKVKRFRQSRSDVLMRIPQLDRLLRILLGEMEDLSDVAGGDWMLMSLAMLLFVYPPPLTRLNLSQIVNEAVVYLEGAVDASGNPKIIMDASLSVTVREVLAGNVGPVLISLHEAGNRFLASASPAPSPVHSVSLLSIAHLAQLLVIGADKKELTSKLSSTTKNLVSSSGGGGRMTSLGSDFECEDVSFLEKLILEAGQSLNKLEDLPIQILLGYMDACPEQGRAYARCLLLRRVLSSDDQALNIASALHSLDFVKDAETVVMQRVNYWLQLSHPIYRSLDFVKSISRPHVDVVDHCLDTAQPYPSQSLFMAVQLLQRINDTAYLDSLIDRSLYQCMCAVASCAPLFTGLSVFPMAPVPNNSPLFVYQPSVPEKKEIRTFSKEEESQLISHLESVLQESNEVLDAIDVEGYIPTSNMQILSAYVEAIRARLYESESLNALYSAAVTINDLLSNEQLSVPYRYYLHLVDLSLWLSRAIVELKKIQLYSPRVNDPAAVDGNGNADSRNHYVLSRAEGYRLLAGFTKITTSWASERFVAGSGANAADLQALRLALLGQVANSVVQDNANHHASRMALSRVNGGSGTPGSGMMKSDVFLRNRLPHATTNVVGAASVKPTGISSKLSLTGLKSYHESPSFSGVGRNVYFRAAGYPTDPEKANEIRSQMKTFEALTASVNKFSA